MSEEFDPFRELQLSPEAEPELIKAAFKALAKKYHPDRFSDPEEKAQAEKRMQRINEAQAMLASGDYRPPKPEPEESVEPPPRVVPPPPPVRRSPGVRKISMGPVLAAVVVVIFALVVPNMFSADRVNKALQLEHAGQHEEAISQLNEAIGNNPKSGEAYFHRARLWKKTGHPERAKVDISNARGLLSERQWSELESAHPWPQASPTPQPTQAEVRKSESTNGADDGLP